MPRKSSVRKLPKEFRSEVDRLLRDGRHTLDEILAHLRTLGNGDISRSALGRYKKDFDTVAKRLRESREVVEQLTVELGPQVTEGRHGRLLVESLRALTFDVLLPKLHGEETDTKELFFLAQSIKAMSQAARQDQDFETKIREQAAAEAKRSAASAAEDVGREQGLSAQTVEAIKASILGVAEAG